MSNGIHPSLMGMAVDIDTLLPLEKNPRVGDVDAITASYVEFGQVKPIVAKRNDDGTATVIAGNHQLEAAKILGWDQIAVIYLEGTTLVLLHLRSPTTEQLSLVTLSRKSFTN